MTPGTRQSVRRKRRPGERAGLDQARVLAEARALLRRDGIDGLSMRRLADQIGVAPNALYSHFADKAALLDTLLDTLLADVPAPAADRVEWREGLVTIMADSRRLMLQHADLIPHFMSRPGRGRNAIRLGEATLALLARGGVTGKAAVAALQILLIFTFGFVAYEAPRRADPAPAKRQSLGEEAFRSAEQAPRVRRAAADLARQADDATFEKGLRWMLAGIAGDQRRIRATVAEA